MVLQLTYLNGRRHRGRMDKGPMRLFNEGLEKDKVPKKLETILRSLDFQGKGTEVSEIWWERTEIPFQRVRRL